MAKCNTDNPPAVKLINLSRHDQPARRPADAGSKWGKDTCPNCGYLNADVDDEGVLWCPACGYSKKGCYT